MFENPQFPKNEFVKKHDESYPKREIDLQLEKLVSDQELSTLGAISATARLITRMKPMEEGEFKILTDEYIDLRIERKEFDKALHYSYNALFDCIKDADNPEKQKRKNKILDYIALCAQSMKDESQE